MIVKHFSWASHSTHHTPPHHTLRYTYIYIYIITHSLTKLFTLLFDLICSFKTFDCLSVGWNRCECNIHFAFSVSCVCVSAFFSLPLSLFFFFLKSALRVKRLSKIIYAIDSNCKSNDRAMMKNSNQPTAKICFSLS